MLRFWELGQMPPSLDWDEVSMGYNAYSILKTGRDEFGTAWPVYFRALDDYKLPVYTYLTAGSIKIWGYNDFAVRFPSAFFGTLTVLLIYFLTKELFENSKIENSLKIGNWNLKIEEIAAILLAISPWQIQFSRMASEVNVGLFWLTLGVVLWSVGWRRGRMLAVVSWGLAGYTYLAFRLMAPLLGLGLAVRDRRWWLVVVMIGLLVIGLERGHLRIKGTSAWETEAVYQVFKHQEAEMMDDARNGINWPRKLWHEQRWLTGAMIATQGYLSHFSPSFLFFDYEEPQHQTPFVGLNYLWMLPLVVVGGYYMAVKGYSRGAKVILWWLVLAPLPAAVTRGVPHAGRTLAMTVPLMVMAAFGWRFWVGRWPWFLKVAAVGVVGLALVQYLHQYYIHLPIERSATWQYGRREMTEYVEQVKDQYDRVVVSSKLEWPYIFMLYYSRYDPAAYLAQGGTKSGGWGEEGNRYDKYEFHQFRPEDLHDPKALLAGTPDELVERVDPVKVINYLDGKPAIIIGPGRAR